MSTKTKGPGSQKKRSFLVIPLLLALIVIGASLSILDNGPQRSSDSSKVGPLKAVVIDELAVDAPNPFFAKTAAGILVNASYSFDYYGPKEVTLDLYKRLPSMGYGIVILRAHTAGWAVNEGPGHADSAIPTFSIATTEPYSTSSHVLDQLFDHVQNIALDKQYFAITDKFVVDEMQGTFPNSIIIMMGCGSLTGVKLASGLLDRGAVAYIGWDGLVTSSYTDEATLSLLRYLVYEKTIGEAIHDAMSNVGYDPVYHSGLGFYDSTSPPTTSIPINHRT